MTNGTPSPVLRSLPNGGVTFDVVEYLEVWHAFLDPLAEKMEMEIHSYGGGEVAFIQDGDYCAMPLWFATKLRALLVEDVSNG